MKSLVSVLSLILQLLLVVLLFAQPSHGQRLALGGRGRRLFNRPCDLPTLTNGKILRMQKGKMVQYICNSLYQLIGSKYTTCRNQRWDSPVPICAKAGCENITTADVQGHQVSLSHDRISATLRCHSEYVLKGASIAYCDGHNWDRSLGTCQKAGIDNLGCDFESEDLCGWSHDENNDFRWARRSGQPLSLRLRTGPRTDHTVGILHEGHYMLLESFEHKKDDIAVFFSPIYSAEKSKDSCFRFYYHMYGLNVGTLKVYVRPLSVDLDTLAIEPKYQFFEKTGNQRNIWREAKFLIEELDESFQIVFEGVLRSSLFGDIAVDDVELLQGEECLPDVLGTTTENGEVTREAEMEDNFAVILSCENRCGERGNKTAGGCDCHNDCSDACCPDFGKVCLATSISSSSRETPPTTTPTMKTTRETTTRKTVTQGSFVKMTTVKTKATEIITPPTTISGKREVVEAVIKILPKELEKYGEEPVDSSIVSVHKTVIFVSLIGFLCISLIVTMFVVRHYQKRRRLCDPEFYKRRGNDGDKKKNGSLSAREEFSEIRYLTQDEHLDFTLVTPPRQSTTFRPVEGNAKATGREQNLVDDPEDVDEEHKMATGKKSGSGGSKKSKFQKKAYKDDEPDNEGLLGEDNDYEEL